MHVSLAIDIDANPEQVWSVVSDIENSGGFIRAIDSIEVLEQATGPSIKGLKWRETRTMFGKEATEVMWITEAKEPEFYVTRAESHGSIYSTRLSIEAMYGGSRLTMSFKGIPQTRGAKIMWFLTGWMAKGAMRKALQADLEDIRKAAEEASS